MFTNYHTFLQRTDCIITSEVGDERIEAIQQRLSDAFCTSAISSAVDNASDPFFMHGLIAHQAFMDSDPVIFHLGRSLYDTLDQLNEYADKGFDRDRLKSTTFKLHEISQDMDSLLTSADTNIALVKTIQDTQNLLLTLCPKESHWLQSSMTTSAWLNRAFEARKRWLLGARARKKTALNLVSSNVMPFGCALEFPLTIYRFSGLSSCDTEGYRIKYRYCSGYQSRQCLYEDNCCFDHDFLARIRSL